MTESWSLKRWLAVWTATVLVGWGGILQFHQNGSTILGWVLALVTVALFALVVMKL